MFSPHRTSALRRAVSQVVSLVRVRRRSLLLPSGSSSSARSNAINRIGFIACTTVAWLALLTGAMHSGSFSDKPARARPIKDCRARARRFERVRGRCRSNGCLTCAPKEAWLTAGALGLARCERHVRISNVGNDWETVQRRLNELVRTLRSAGYEWSWAYSAEPNPGVPGFHVHGWQRGSFVSQAVLQHACERVGLGQPWIGAITRREGAPLPYGLKVALELPDLPVDVAVVQLRSFLAINGNRLIHSSRGFWCGLDGRPVPLRHAQRHYCLLRDIEGPWSEA